MAEFLNPAPRFFDATGNVLAAGKIYFYTTGTLTLKNLYTDINLTTAAANPVVLGGGGEMPLRYLDGSYRIKIFSAAGTLIDDVDPIGGNPALFGAFGDWNASVVYSIGDKVQASDNTLWNSLQNNNIAKNPVTPNNDYWEEVALLRIWNTNVTYAVGDYVRGSDFHYYRCLTAQAGNDPITDFTRTNWVNEGMTKAARAGALTYATTI